ncbi:hypothetical protein [Clostridium sp.]|nr:hypothetical protein [Clostridium sp.]
MARYKLKNLDELGSGEDYVQDIFYWALQKKSRHIKENKLAY